MSKLFWNGPRVGLVGVTRERAQWRLEFQLNGDGHSRYSYYPNDKFIDEIAAYKWWKEQTNGYAQSRA